MQLLRNGRIQSIGAAVIGLKLMTEKKSKKIKGWFLFTVAEKGENVFVLLALLKSPVVQSDVLYLLFVRRPRVEISAFVGKSRRCVRYWTVEKAPPSTWKIHLVCIFDQGLAYSYPCSIKWGEITRKINMHRSSGPFEWKRLAWRYVHIYVEGKLYNCSNVLKRGSQKKIIRFNVDFLEAKMREREKVFVIENFAVAFSIRCSFCYLAFFKMGFFSITRFAFKTHFGT